VATGCERNAERNEPKVLRLHGRSRTEPGADADKILRRANPAGLPIDQPTTFDLVVNLKTAKARGALSHESYSS